MRVERQLLMETLRKQRRQDSFYTKHTHTKRIVSVNQLRMREHQPTVKTSWGTKKE